MTPHLNDAYGEESLRVLADLFSKAHERTVAIPTDYGRSIHNAWAQGELAIETAIALLIAWHKARPALDDDDRLARPNRLGIIDSARLREAETDLTTLRMMQMQRPASGSGKEEASGPLVPEGDLR